MIFAQIYFSLLFLAAQLTDSEAREGEKSGIFSLFAKYSVK